MTDQLFFHHDLPGFGVPVDAPLPPLELQDRYFDRLYRCAYKPSHSLDRSDIYLAWGVIEEWNRTVSSVQVSVLIDGQKDILLRQRIFNVIRFHYTPIGSGWFKVGYSSADSILSTGIGMTRMEDDVWVIHSPDPDSFEETFASYESAALHLYRRHHNWSGSPSSTRSRGISLLSSFSPAQ